MKDNRLNQIANELCVNYYPCYCKNGVWAKKHKCKDCGSEYSRDYRAYITQDKTETTEDLINDMFKDDEERKKALEIYRNNQTF